MKIIFSAPILWYSNSLRLLYTNDYHFEILYCQPATTLVRTLYFIIACLPQQRSTSIGRVQRISSIFVFYFYFFFFKYVIPSTRHVFSIVQALNSIQTFFVHTTRVFDIKWCKRQFSRPKRILYLRVFPNFKSVFDAITKTI